ncbi:hypothetical protein EUGRSUZ_E01483 [Eucalyptus grandis]|uniref:Uncharacterized protein n=2 Tax=Eucalyptus grandis TaxID=71139 RepID=A0ACC3KUY8_EUCGR|nr:hypothetical protein EUGRSUZ_E01483 [Eucalyptus grandis]
MAATVHGSRRGSVWTLRIKRRRLRLWRHRGGLQLRRMREASVVESSSKDEIWSSLSRLAAMADPPSPDLWMRRHVSHEQEKIAAINDGRPLPASLAIGPSHPSGSRLFLFISNLQIWQRVPHPWPSSPSPASLFKSIDLAIHGRRRRRATPDGAARFSAGRGAGSFIYGSASVLMLDVVFMLQIEQSLVFSDL